jgi:hypothetical protein
MTSKGVNITYKPLDEDHVWAIVTWSEQDGQGSGKKHEGAPKPPGQLESDAKARSIDLAGIRQ